MRARNLDLVVLLALAGCTGERSLVLPPAGNTDAGGVERGAADGGVVQRTGELCNIVGCGAIACEPQGPPPCWNTCGPAKSGFRNCACDATGTWACDSVCHYEAGADTSCFALPDPVPACPPDATDTTGLQIPQSGGACALEACRPCGSSTVPAFRDSTGAPKVGFCICVPVDGGIGGVYSCAKVSDWPAATLASPPDDETSEC